MAQSQTTYVLTFSSGDRIGIVAAVSGYLASVGGFITDSQQYADLELGRFFMRVEFKGEADHFPARLGELQRGFADVAGRFGLDWHLTSSSRRVRFLIAVSKASHCLNDLLHRWQTGNLPIDITGVVSNHPDLRALTEWHQLPFHHLPIRPETRAEQEAQLHNLVQATGTDYLVLARYMQVLSPWMAEALTGRCINIHHSFLPSFKGAHPYQRAHERGVKLIGATAHFVTADLDEGPIIEQDVERVDHRATEADLIRIGKDIEARVLARAVRWTAERRVFLNGIRTVVFG